MTERVATWGGLWGIRNGTDCCSEVMKCQVQLLLDASRGDLQESEDVFSLEDVRRCIRTAPPKAALGADQWRPHDWRNLPEDGVRELRGLLVAVEGKTQWPSQVLHNVVAFLGKPTTPPSESRPIVC